MLESIVSFYSINMPINKEYTFISSTNLIKVLLKLLKSSHKISSLIEKVLFFSAICKCI